MKNPKLDLTFSDVTTLMKALDVAIAERNQRLKRTHLIEDENLRQGMNEVFGLEIVRFEDLIQKLKG